MMLMIIIIIMMMTMTIIMTIMMAIIMTVPLHFQDPCEDRHSYHSFAHIRPTRLPPNDVNNNISNTITILIMMLMIPAS